MKLKRINELCDILYYFDYLGKKSTDLLSNEYSVEYGEKNIFPFYWFVDEINGKYDVGIAIGKESQAHDDTFKPGDYFDAKFNGKGRIWGDQKILTFWEFPEKSFWKEFITSLERNSGFDIWNNGWRVEVSRRSYPNIANTIDDKYKNNKIGYDEYHEFMLIPVEQFKGDIDASEKEQLMHLMRIQDKAKLKKPKFFGSKADNRPLKWKQKLLLSEKKDIIGTPIGKIRDISDLQGKKLYDPYSDCYLLINDTIKLIDTDNDNLIYEFDLPSPGHETKDEYGNKLYLDYEMEYLDFLDHLGSSEYEMSIPDLEIITEHIKSFKLFESPDEIKLKNTIILGPYDMDSISFGYYGNKMYVSDKGELHYDILQDNNLLDWDNEETARTNFKYPGRIWTRRNIISFWVYPSKDEFKDVIRDLEKALEDKFMRPFVILNSNSYLIEIVPESDKKIIYPVIDDSVFPIDDIGSWREAGRFETGKLIPIQEYSGSEERSEEELKTQHQSSPLRKKKNKNKEFFEIRNKKEKPLKLKQRMYSENVNSFESYIKEQYEEITSVLVYITDDIIEWQLLDEIENENLDVDHGYEGNNFSEGILTIDVKKNELDKLILLIEKTGLKYDFQN